MTEYGPHRDQDAPNAVVVLRADRRRGIQPHTVVLPLPLRLREQRRQLNQLAHRQAATAVTGTASTPVGGGGRG